MTRDEVVRAAMAAQTLQECEAAEAALREWLRLHPDDFGMLDVGEGLAMLKDAFSPPDEPGGVEGRESGGGPRSAEEDTRHYAISFGEEVRLAQTEFGWDEATAHEFVASYRTPPEPAPPCDAGGEPLVGTPVRKTVPAH